MILDLRQSMDSQPKPDKQWIIDNYQAVFDNEGMALTRYTIRQIEAFIAINERGSFAAAAQQLGLTPQAVSQLVAELENVLGFRVFDRTTRQVALSSAGQDFLPAAMALLSHIAAADRAADDIRNRMTGAIRVGAPQVLASTALPAAIRAYQAGRPKVSIRVRDLPVHELEAAVAAGDVDLAIGPDRPVARDVHRKELFDTLWVLWCARTHPFANKQGLRWQDLHDIPLVAAGRDHEHSVTQMRPDEFDGALSSPLEIVENTSTALGIAAQGLAATLTPAYVGVLAPAYDLVMKRVGDPEVLRKVCLYWSSARALSPAAEGFSDFLGPCLTSWAHEVDQRNTVYLGPAASAR